MIVYSKKDLKEIWCPNVRLLQLSSGKVMTNRGQLFDPTSEDPKNFCRCIGRNCAQWEWRVHDVEGFCSFGTSLPSTVTFRREKVWKPREQ